jgi:hypothetical protein
MAAEKLEIAKQEVKADAPGDGSQRQVMPGKPQGQQTQHKGHQGGNHQPDHQPDPGRTA